MLKIDMDIRYNVLCTKCKARWRLLTHEEVIALEHDCQRDKLHF